MPYLILFLFLLAIACPFIFRWKIKAKGWWLALFPLAFFILFLIQIPTLLNGDVIFTEISWLPAAGINLGFYLDGLSLLFAILITGIGALIVIYSDGYLNNHPQLGRYYGYLFFFMAAMLGTVLADNLITLFIFWELTGISSYLLISFNYTHKAARRAAMQGLLITTGGGLAMLIGFLLIGLTLQNLSLMQLLANHQVLVNSSRYTAMVLLILIGAFTKSAQVPFHFWLPRAMEAPTPISAYLHSATMVKLGVYLVARLTPLLGHTPLWIGLLTSVGALTMIVGAFLSLRANDLKLILAYSTIMALGILLFLLASGEPEAVEAAMVFLLAHALYKAALFLSVGIIDQSTGTRELSQLGGLYRSLPITFVAVLLSAISMAGLPPVIGFIGKEMIFTAKLSGPQFTEILILVALLTNVVLMIIAGLFVMTVFLRPAKPTSQFSLTPVRDSKNILCFAPVILGLLGLFFGLNSSTIDNELIAPATQSILQEPVTLVLGLWHGVTPALLLTGMTLLFAIIGYCFYIPCHRWLKNRCWIDIYSPSQGYELTLRGLNYTAYQLTRCIQTGVLRAYTAVTFMVISGLTLFTFYHFKHIHPVGIWPKAPWFGWCIALLMAISAIAIVLTDSSIASLAMLGIIGLGSTLIFLLYSAPDVAMTQLLVDVLTIVILVLALYRFSTIPIYEPFSKRIRLFNLVVCAAVGTMVTTILLCILNVPLNLIVNNFYSTYSLSLAHGRNVVNVIIVDFRAFDTLGEIIVIGLAGLGVYGLLKIARDGESE